MSWETILKDNITTTGELKKELNLTEEECRNIDDEIQKFPMSITRYYLSLIDKNDPNDPIRKLAVPSGINLEDDGILDTSGEGNNTKLKGLQHKYRETALILTTSACAMYCRHCFRRRLVGLEETEAGADIGEAAEYIAGHPEINNVLLSGGDSFLMPTDKIRKWLEALCEIESLDIIRFGTRTPVTFPQRILEDPEFTEVLAKYNSRKQIYIITHFNHPNEFTPVSEEAIRRLREAGAVVKNQTVLLKGVNDDPAVLGTLLRKVSALGIVQHYIFQCRPVKGVKSNFQVSLRKGLQVVQKANAMQNGLGKSADYTMSHPTGKIRIIGTTGAFEDRMLFQYKQAKDERLIGKMFLINPGSSAWLPDNIPEEAIL